VRNRVARLGELQALRESAQGRWGELIATMRAQTAAFAELVKAYARV
jgi:hypothetical protein